MAKNGRKVFIGALLNAEAVAKAALKIAEKERAGISLVLSGKRGDFSLEDFLCAGAISGSFPIDKVKYSDAAFAALLAFQQARGSLSRFVQRGNHAQHLKSIGFEEDLHFCCQLNVKDVVPTYRNGIIVHLDLRIFR